MLSSVVLIPEEKLGIAIFTNKLPNAAYVLLSHYLTEKIIGVPTQDWIQIYDDLYKEENAKAEAAKKQESRLARKRYSSIAGFGEICRGL